MLMSMMIGAMPFQTDDTWPAGLLTIFNHARAKRTSSENRYYGPYDKLLNYCFGDSFTFYLAPQNPPRDDSWAVKAELRYRTDVQMCDKYAVMLDDCPFPRLWSLSLLGTFARVYCDDKAT